MSALLKIAISIVLASVGAYMAGLSIYTKGRVLLFITGFALVVGGAYLAITNVDTLTTCKITINGTEFVDKSDHLEIKITMRGEKEADISINGQEFAMIDGKVYHGDNLFPPEANYDHEVPAPDPAITNDPVATSDFDPDSV